MRKPLQKNPSWYLDPEPFVVRLEEWLERQGDRGDQEINASDFIATHMGVTLDWVGAFRRRRYKTLHFDRADALMCAMNVAHEWLTDDTFWRIYKSIDFKKLDEAKPCDRVAPDRSYRSGPTRSFDYDEAQRLLATGMSYATVGRALGVSKKSIQSAIARMKRAA